jgi:hypothetical protein
MRQAAKIIGVLGVLATGCETGGESIGPRGGTVVSEDGRFALEIPAGALDEEVDVSIEEAPCTEPGAIGPCYAVGPRGTAFKLPATASYELGGMDLGDVDPNDLHLVIERDGRWNMLADLSIDFDGEVVEASALYLSSFGIVAIESPTDDDGTCCDDGDPPSNPNKPNGD